MCCLTVQIECPKCKNKCNRLWPIGGGMCDSCLRIKIRSGKLSLKKTKERVDECLHKELIKILAP